MKIVMYPGKDGWEELSKRPAVIKSDLDNTVREIINSVKSDKDAALYRFTEKFDGMVKGNLKASTEEINEAVNLVPQNLRDAINIARKNIEHFHSAQLINESVIETFEGVRCWRKNVAIEKVGLYIPGGNAPLFSTVLMLGIPAKIAGCREIILCTPPGTNGNINPVILYTADLLGIKEIFKVGGAQAIAAMAYGTESIPGVYKIFGPGNQFVTKAKEQVQQDGIAIDFPAGPSEVLIIADENADPVFVAADLLAQAEHGPDSQVIMLSDNQKLIHRVIKELDFQIKTLPRKDIAMKSLENSKLILLPTLDDCMDFSNFYAPEHLIINTDRPDYLAEKVINAGSVFLGRYSCESAGDYASGTNHTLPTNGSARTFSGVSVESFTKKITFQEISSIGIAGLGPSVEIMAEAESLSGHRNAVSVRLKRIQND
jgi:histidinol dehydrogenase